MVFSIALFVWVNEQTVFFTLTLFIALENTEFSFTTFVTFILALHIKLWFIALHNNIIFGVGEWQLSATSPSPKQARFLFKRSLVLVPAAGGGSRMGQMSFM